MLRCITILTSLLFALVSVGIDEKAPEFSLQGSDGKTHTLGSLLSDGDVVFYFMASTCPSNAVAVKYYNRIAEAYLGKARIVGVFDGNLAEFADWQKKFNSPFLMLFDYKLKTIQAFKAGRSPWIIHVKKNGTIGKVWKGYCKSMFEELNQLMAKIAGVPAKKIDLSGAPVHVAYGCPF